MICIILLLKWAGNVYTEVDCDWRRCTFGDSQESPGGAELEKDQCKSVEMRDYYTQKIYFTDPLVSAPKKFCNWSL